MKERIQRFGKSLSSMVMPNIGAFIAWGFITALFIPTGWWPNASLGQLVEPMLRYLLPLLIAMTAGRFLLQLWYFGENADTDKLQRVIDCLLKALSAERGKA